jgi:hypothetical protein
MGWLMNKAEKVVWEVLRIAHMMMQINFSAWERVIGRESNMMSMPSARRSSRFLGTA